ncbi:hypothetical protein [uncultured Williamsia sp.]|uniref:hypothetical protein n=1 Tax=uncultured Williamsia sp. TaxID=259311 RepID=UPI00261C42FF|nr:hypothetical protein [uncultured Williamsia sp.]
MTMIDRGSPRESADHSPLAALGITARVRGVHRLSDGALAARMVALTGPPGSSLEAEDDLRHVAALMQQTADLDDYAIRFTRRLAAAADLPLLTVVDPSSAANLAVPLTGLSVSLEPRDFARSPRRCLDTVRVARAAGRRVCVRVGVDDLALAVLPIIEPDVVVLRSEVIAQVRDPSVARLVQEVTAHLENSAAVVLAEGVDSLDAARTALSLGAQYGTGAAFDDPASVAVVAPFPAPVAPCARHEPTGTPFAILAATHRPRRGDESLLQEMGRSLEAQATGTGAAALVVRTAGASCELGHLTARRWDGIADTTGMTTTYGVRMPLLRTTHDAQHPTGPGWNIAVVGPHVAALLAARPLPSADGDRRFEFVQTYDRATVVAATRALLREFAEAN